MDSTLAMAACDTLLWPAEATDDAAGPGPLEPAGLGMTAGSLVLTCVNNQVVLVVRMS